jgi:Ca2+-binding EF-hand superfamily protein
MDSYLKNVDSFLLKKWDHAFAVFFDMNKDGVLEWEDFEILVSAIKHSRGEDSEDYRRALVAMKEIWQKLLSASDVDGDNKVSVDEWKHMWYTSMGNDDDLAWQQLYLDYVFRLFDTSADGVIDLSEFIESMAYYGIDKRHATWAFDKFAFGPKGQRVHAITRQQFNVLWKEYFQSLDVTKPGNYLFGDINNEYDPSQVKLLDD